MPRRSLSDMKPEVFRDLAHQLGLGSIDLARLFGVSARCVNMWKSGFRSVPSRVEVTLRTMQACSPVERLEYYRKAFRLSLPFAADDERTEVIQRLSDVSAFTSFPSMHT